VTNFSGSHYDTGSLWHYGLYTFTVDASGTYNATVRTGSIVSTSFFLNGLYSPGANPSTPITNFVAELLATGSPNYTSNFSNLSFTAGNTYSFLVAWGTGTALTDQFTLSMSGPGCIAISTIACTVSTSKPYFTLADSVAQGSTVTFTGGTLKVTDTSTLAKPIVIQSTGGTINSNGNVLYLTGNVSGTGALTVSGTNGGEVHANNLIMVPVTVDASGTLRGIGAISGNTTVAGTLSPGNSPGTLTFLAPVTMQSGSTLALDIDGTGTGTGAGNYSRAIVQGSTFTAAGTLAPKLRGITYAATETPGTNSYTPPLGQKFAGVVQADGGVIGSFSSLTQPAGLQPGTRFDVTYNPTSLDLYVTPSQYANLAAAGSSQTTNQSAAGAALDGFRPAAGTLASGDTKTVFDALAPLDRNALPRAMTQIAGEGNANLALTGLDVGRSFGDAVGARLGQLHGGQGSIAEQASRNLTSLQFNNQGGNNAGMGAGETAGGDASQARGAWVRGFGKFSANNGDGNNPGFDRDIAGGVAGFDAPVATDLRVGLAVGYAWSDMTGKLGSGNATADSYNASAYASWTPGAWFVDASQGVTYNKFDTTRNIAFGPLNRGATGTTSGFDLGTAVEAGRRFDVQGYSVVPSVDLRYDALTTNGFSESGAGILNLTSTDQAARALRGGLGGKVSRVFDIDNGAKLEPELSARWEHDVLDQNYRTNQSLNGTGFTITDAKPGRDAAVLGIGVAALVDDSLKLYAHYDAELRSNQTDHTVTAGLRYNW
jgi:outer membrane autotransporter protein